MMLYSAKTDRGLVRSSNQDAYSTLTITPTLAFFLVCDGMGGANGGETASRTACDTATESIAKDLSVVAGDEELDADKYIPKLLTYAAREANLAVYDKSQSDPSLRGMGTTFVGAVVARDELYVVNIGDSRLYLITESGINQITRDHSYVQYLVDMGVMTSRQAETSSKRNIITRAVGTYETVDADTYTVTLGDDDYILLCSDGLSGMVDREEIFGIVRGDGTLEQKIDALISAAKAHGGHDNITAVLVKPSDK